MSGSSRSAFSSASRTVSAYPLPAAAGCLQRSDCLSVAAHGMGRLEIRLRIGRIGAGRLLRQLHGALEQRLLLVASGDVVAVNRQCFGRQRISLGRLQGFAKLGGFEKPAFGVCCARRFDGLGTGGTRRRQEHLHDYQEGRECSSHRETRLTRSLPLRAGISARRIFHSEAGSNLAPRLAVEAVAISGPVHRAWRTGVRCSLGRAPRAGRGRIR